MNARRAELQRLHFRPEGDQARGQRIVGLGDNAIQNSGDLGCINDHALAVIAQRICGRDQFFRIGQVLVKQFGIAGGFLGRAAQAHDQARERRDLRAAGHGLQPLAIAGELVGLLAQAEGQRLRPVNVGASVQVIADPARQRRQEGPQLAPLVRECLAGDVKNDAGIHLLRSGSVQQRLLNLIMLAVQVDALVPLAAILADMFQ